MNSKSRTLFIKRLAFLLNAGIPLLSALEIIASQGRSKRQHHMVESLIRDIAEGQSLGRAMEKFPRIFTPFARVMVDVGEKSGTLGSNLLYLADELRKREILRRKIVGACIYPLLITVATFGIVAFLMLYLFPKIMPIFSSLHVEMPLTTQIVMGVSLFLQAWGLVLFVSLIVLTFLGTILHKKWEKFRVIFDAMVVRVPLFGKAVRHYNLSQGARTMSILLKSGIPLSDALPTLARTTTHTGYKRQYVLLTDAVYRGEKISSQMGRSPVLFPDMFGSLVAVGESSGTLSDTLLYLSEMYESEVEDFTKHLATLLEPALMITMGLLVGLIAVSIITPIYGITQNLHN